MNRAARWIFSDSRMTCTQRWLNLVPHGAICCSAAAPHGFLRWWRKDRFSLVTARFDKRARASHGGPRPSGQRGTAACAGG